MAIMLIALSMTGTERYRRRDLCHGLPYLTYRSRTYGVFVFWRGFFKDPKQLEAPVAVMEQTRIYPLGEPGHGGEHGNVGAKYPATFVDAKGQFLSGSNSYSLNLPHGIAPALFWSVTAYDSITASGLDNGRFQLVTTCRKRPKADGQLRRFSTHSSPSRRPLPLTSWIFC